MSANRLSDGPAETWLESRYNAEHIEKRGIGWDLQIEINKAVDQNARAAEHSCQRDCSINIFRPVSEFLYGAAI